MIIFNIIIFTYLYGSLYRRNLKKKFLLIGLVQDHHIIPNEFKNYIINSSILTSIHDSKNIIMLPTSYGKLLINTKRPIHENGHKKYNNYVKKLLEIYDIDDILYFLKYQIIKNSNNITKLI
jgi:hypothetical protein